MCTLVWYTNDLCLLECNAYYQVKVIHSDIHSSHSQGLCLAKHIDKDVTLIPVYKFDVSKSKDAIAQPPNSTTLCHVVSNMINAFKQHIPVCRSYETVITYTLGTFDVNEPVVTLFVYALETSPCFVAITCFMESQNVIE